MLGYSLSGHDNGSFFYAGAVGVPACRACGLVNDLTWVNGDFRLKTRELDFSYTYDGAPIVSDRFVEVTRSQPGVTYLPLPSEPGFALIVVHPVVAFDAERRGTEFLYACPECSRFTQVAGATPVYLRPGTALPPGFSRTDVVFGSAAGSPDQLVAQAPKLLVGPELGDALTAQEFRGLILKPIAGAEGE